MRGRKLAIYQRDLAAAHAAGFSGLSLAGGRLVLDALHDAGLHAGTIVDLGCGAGEWVRLAAEHGFDLVGVDASSDMTSLARTHAPSARIVTASLWDFELPRTPVAAVTAFGEALNYGEPSLADIAALSARVRAALVPGGLFVCDVLVSGEPMRYRAWTEAGDHTVLVDVDEDQPASTLSRSIVVFTKQGDGYRRSDERHVVRVFDEGDVQRVLAGTGLRCTRAHAYGDVVLGPRRTAFIARA